MNDKKILIGKKNLPTKPERLPRRFCRKKPERLPGREEREHSAPPRQRVLQAARRGVSEIGFSPDHDKDKDVCRARKSKKEVGKGISLDYEEGCGTSSKGREVSFTE